MNKDLAGVSAIWRALGEVRVDHFYRLSACCQRSRRNGFAADFGSVSGGGRSFRCCTVGELLRDCDLVSVRAVQEKCDEKGGGARLGRAHARDGRGIPSLESRETWGTRQEILLDKGFW
jgi:hypothetical protein